MVHTYGTSQGNAYPVPKQSTNKQVSFAMGLVGLALVMCMAIVASSDLKSQRVALYQPSSAKRMALYGLGSGAEDDAEISVAAVLATFEGQDKMLKETLADEYYVDLFEQIKESEETGNAVEEVKVAIDEAKNEHKILGAFAAGADDPVVSIEDTVPAEQAPAEETPDVAFDDTVPAEEAPVGPVNETVEESLD